jgi:ATP adenylyltransferase
MTYIQNPKETTCIFCAGKDQPDRLENLVVYRGKLAFVMLNRYPYTSGHLMTVPIVHCASLNDLDPEMRFEMIELANQAIKVLQILYHPEGFNVGINMGAAAGAGIVNHVHLHVVPRWVGDTNFMSSISAVRVLPEMVDDTYQKVKQAWGKMFDRLV